MKSTKGRHKSSARATDRVKGDAEPALIVLTGPKSPSPSTQQISPSTIFAVSPPEPQCGSLTKEGVCLHNAGRVFARRSYIQYSGREGGGEGGILTNSAF